MRQVAFFPAAISGIDGIWDHAAETWDVDQADRYTNDIRDVCEDLAQGKKQGRAVSVRDGYLKYAIGRHFVFFVRADDGIAVVRVLHQQMEVNRHL